MLKELSTWMKENLTKSDDIALKRDAFHWKTKIFGANVDLLVNQIVSIEKEYRIDSFFCSIKSVWKNFALFCPHPVLLCVLFFSMFHSSLHYILYVTFSASHSAFHLILPFISFFSASTIIRLEVASLFNLKSNYLMHMKKIT